MKVFIPSSRFRKKIKKLPKEIIKALEIKLPMFKENEFDVVLNNHTLKGDFDNMRSINITGDWRLIYGKRVDGDREIYSLFDIGTHSELY